MSAPKPLADREFAVAFLAAWASPYFGEDSNDAVARVQMALREAGATGTKDGSQREETLTQHFPRRFGFGLYYCTCGVKLRRPRGWAKHVAEVIDT